MKIRNLQLLQTKESKETQGPIKENIFNTIIKDNLSNLKKITISLKRNTKPQLELEMKTRMTNNNPNTLFPEERGNFKGNFPSHILRHVL